MKRNKKREREKKKWYVSSKSENQMTKPPPCRSHDLIDNALQKTRHFCDAESVQAIPGLHCVLRSLKTPILFLLWLEYLSIGPVRNHGGPDPGPDPRAGPCHFRILGGRSKPKSTLLYLLMISYPTGLLDTRLQPLCRGRQCPIAFV